MPKNRVRHELAVLLQRTRDQSGEGEMRRMTYLLVVDIFSGKCVSRRRPAGHLRKKPASVNGDTATQEQAATTAGTTKTTTTTTTLRISARACVTPPPVADGKRPHAFGSVRSRSWYTRTHARTHTLPRERYDIIHYANSPRRVRSLGSSRTVVAARFGRRSLWQ